MARRLSRSDAALLLRRCLSEFPRSDPSRLATRLLRAELRPARGDQTSLGSRQSVHLRTEHPDGGLTIRVRRGISIQFGRYFPQGESVLIGWVAESARMSVTALPEQS